jgi:hypothetical protein
VSLLGLHGGVAAAFGLPGEGVFTRRPDPLPAVLQAAIAIPRNAAWASNCSTAERSLELVWTSRAPPVHADLLTQPERFASLAGKTILLLGDSVMLQTRSAASWALPSLTERGAPPLSTFFTTSWWNSVPRRCALPLSGPLAFGFAHTTLLSCRTNLVSGLAELLDQLVHPSRVDVVAFNSGVWYNLGMHFASKEQEQAARNATSGWKPLGREQYETDLGLLHNQLVAYRAAHGLVPRILWVETAPSHFVGGTFSNISQHQTDCAQFTPSDYNTSNWRNELSEAALSSLPPGTVTFVRHASHLAPMYMSHPHSQATGEPSKKISVDCTHWCDPGFAPLHALQMIFNAAAQLAY